MEVWKVVIRSKTSFNDESILYVKALSAGAAEKKALSHIKRLPQEERFPAPCCVSAEFHCYVVV